MVKEALRERASMLESAPHLTHPLPIMLPVYTWVDSQLHVTRLEKSVILQMVASSVLLGRYQGLWFCRRRSQREIELLFVKARRPRALPYAEEWQIVRRHRLLRWTARWRPYVLGCCSDCRPPRCHSRQSRWSEGIAEEEGCQWTRGSLRSQIMWHVDQKGVDSEGQVHHQRHRSVHRQHQKDGWPES